MHDSVIQALPDFSERVLQILSERNLDEANTRTLVVHPLLERLGWDHTDPTEVVTEYPMDSDVVLSKADYALLDTSGSAAVVVEVKPPTKSLGNASKQVREYMRLFGAEYGLCTNARMFRLYQSNGTYQHPEEALVMTASIEEPEKLNSLEFIHKSRFSDDSGDSPRPAVDEYPGVLKNKSDHLKCVYDVLAENGEVEPSALYSEYRARMGELAYSDRTVRNYINELQKYDLVAKKNGRQNRIYIFNPTHEQ